MDPETLSRRVIEAYNSRQLEAQIELFDPEIEIAPLRAAVEDTVYRGHDGIRQYARDMDESWSEVNIEIFETEVRGEQGLNIGRLRLKGRLSGALTEVTAAASCSMRNGRLRRWTYHATVDDARRELGWDT